MGHAVEERGGVGGVVERMLENGERKCDNVAVGEW